MIDMDNQTEFHCNVKALEKIASKLSSKDVELIIVDDKIMQSLNLKYRKKEKSTDVLSFPLDTSSIEQSLNISLGSIVVCKSHIVTKAKQLGHSELDELALLFIHGMLHLLGFDHETDNGEMRQKEEEIINQFDLPKSLIVRTEEF